MIQPMVESSPPEPDRVARMMAQWAVERPDLDVSPMGVIGRLHRLAAALDAELRPVFAEAGLGEGDFDVLAALRRAGDPYALSAGDLGRHTMVTSGAVTKRVDRLVARGLVERRVGAHDARSREVALTPQGLSLIDEVAERHFANEHRLLAGLSDLDRTRLAGLLERWGRSLGA